METRRFQTVYFIYNSEVKRDVTPILVTNFRYRVFNILLLCLICNRIAPQHWQG